MPEYKYVCPDCGHKYSEVRLTTESQWYTKCNACKNADYIEEN